MSAALVVWCYGSECGHLVRLLQLLMLTMQPMLMRLWPVDGA